MLYLELVYHINVNGTHHGLRSQCDKNVEKGYLLLSSSKTTRHLNVELWQKLETIFFIQ